VSRVTRGETGSLPSVEDPSTKRFSTKTGLIVREEKRPRVCLELDLVKKEGSNIETTFWDLTMARSEKSAFKLGTSILAARKDLVRNHRESRLTKN